MKNPIDIIKNKRLTGFSTPFGGISWEDKDVNLKGKKDIQIDYKIRVFISSICGDHGRYDSLRKNLKDTIESTGIAQVYLFSDRPGTTTAINDYTWSVEDSDVCIFIIDNKDGVTEGVQNEIATANRNGIKALYYFCTEFSNKKTQLQLSLEGPGKPKFNVIENFDELMENGAKNLLEEITITYHRYCKGRLVENNSEINVSVSGAEIKELEKIEDKYLPKVTFKNIDKSARYILSKALPKNSLFNSEKDSSSPLDEYELQFLNVLFGETSITDFQIEEYFAELGKIQDEDYLNIVKIRWAGIVAYFKGDLQLCLSEYQKAYQEAQKLDVSSWILQDLLIDIRNISILNGEIVNYYTLESQQKLDEFEEQFHYPVLDRINSSIEEKYIKGLYKKKMDSPNTVYFGSDFSEYGELFASKFLIAMYNGSLTHIRLFFKEMKDFMFYLSEKYDDWIIRINLLKYAIVSGEEKEIGQIVDAYPELLNKMSNTDAIDVIEFSTCIPVEYYREKTVMKAFGTIGYYLDDTKFTEYENRILDYLFDALKQKEIPYLLGTNMFTSLKKVARRMSQEKLVELCLYVFKSGYSRWYMDMFKFIERVDLSAVNEDLRRRLIIYIEELLYDENNSELFSQRILVYLRNSDRVNTERLDGIIKDKFPEYYKHNYLIDTCNGDKKVCQDYILELKKSISERNKTQGKNGMFSGYARNDYVTLRNIFKDRILPEESVVKELMTLAFETIEESKESLITKIDAVEFIIMVLGLKPEYCSTYKEKIDILFSNRKNLVSERLFEISNVDPVAIEVAVVLLKSIVSDEDMYYELLELIALIKNDTATLIKVVAVFRRFYEQNSLRLSERVEIALLSNVLIWVTNNNLDIRWNACKILFDLKQRFKDSNLIDRKLYELMDDDCVYIKYLILDHLDDISIDGKIKDEIINKAQLDNNYLVRLKVKEKNFE